MSELALRCTRLREVLAQPLCATFLGLVSLGCEGGKLKLIESVCGLLNEGSGFREFGCIAAQTGCTTGGGRLFIGNPLL